MFYVLVSEMVTHHFFRGGAPDSPKTMPSWTPSGGGYTLLEPVQLNMIALRRKCIFAEVAIFKLAFCKPWRFLGRKLSAALSFEFRVGETET
jgi:hypothetical protein